jgi:hypothetical protein
MNSDDYNTKFFYKHTWVFESREKKREKEKKRKKGKKDTKTTPPPTEFTTV